MDWSAQRKRIVGDAVLSEAVRAVAVTATEAGGRREMLCLPVDLLNGWLFGVSAERVKPEIRERLIRYQKECYRVLARAFVKEPTAGAVSPTTATLLQVREMGRAIMQMAEEQIESERRLTTTELRLERAAQVYGDLTRCVTTIEQKLIPGPTVAEEQASQISQAVKAVALAFGKDSGRNEFGGVYGEFYRKFGVASNRMLPARRLEEATSFLADWH
ncbi:MAG: hypothetical protein K1X50_15175 [Candidatus Promineofilum sp.]|nr:hypothetical protein [Promineifilum sp.]